MKVTILGVGNVIQQDDGIGIKTIAYLESRYELPESVKIIDGGTVGLGLGHILADQDLLIVVDAVLLDGKPGSVHLLDGDHFKRVSASLKLSPHQVNFLDLISALELEGKAPVEVQVVGIVPVSTDTGTFLSDPVENALVEAAEKVLGILKERNLECRELENPKPADYWWESQISP